MWVGCCREFSPHASPIGLRLLRTDSAPSELTPGLLQLPCNPGGVTPLRLFLHRPTHENGDVVAAPKIQRILYQFFAGLLGGRHGS